MSFRIQPFEPKYQPEVITLIEEIQEGEFSLPIEEGQRKELQSIPESFQKEKSNYWVALFNERVIGTIAVIDSCQREAATIDRTGEQKGFSLCFQAGKLAGQKGNGRPIVLLSP